MPKWNLKFVNLSDRLIAKLALAVSALALAPGIIQSIDIIGQWQTKLVADDFFLQPSHAAALGNIGIFLDGRFMITNSSRNTISIINLEICPRLNQESQNNRDRLSRRCGISDLNLEFPFTLQPSESRFVEFAIFQTLSASGMELLTSARERFPNITSSDVLSLSYWHFGDSPFGELPFDLQVFRNHLEAYQSENYPWITNYSENSELRMITSPYSFSITREGQDRHIDYGSDDGIVVELVVALPGADYRSLGYYGIEFHNGSILSGNGFDQQSVGWGSTPP